MAVYNRVNQLRGRQHGGRIPLSQLPQILEELHVAEGEWHVALHWARRHAPNLWELLFKTLLSRKAG